MNKEIMSELVEEIIVKPSTELIPDEYLHFNDSKILVHVFFDAKEEEKMNILLDSLKKKGYDIPSSNMHILDKHTYDNAIGQIKKEVEGQINGLILIFCGHTKTEGEIEICDAEGHGIHMNIQKIWREFDSYSCIALKNKPKIFILEIKHQSAVETDRGLRISAFEGGYDTPAEADLLIIYNLFRSDDSFLKKLAKNVDIYSEDEDIVTLASCVTSQEYRPLIISTLTRKFFISSSELRGYHRQLRMYSDRVKEVLQEFKISLTDKTKDEMKQSLRDCEITRRKSKNISKDEKSGATSAVPEEKKAHGDTMLHQSRRASKGNLNVEKKPRWK